MGKKDGIEAKVGNSRLNADGDEILITKVYERPDFFDVDIVNKRTGETGFMRRKHTKEKAASS